MGKRTIIATLFLGSCLSLSACAGNTTKEYDKQSDNSTLADSTRNALDDELAIPIPEVPKNITDPKEKATYIVNHFWDALNFNDTTYLQTPDRMEASFANFIALALCFPVKDQVPALLLPLEKSNGSMLKFFLKMYRKYLYDPNSPMRNEEFYIPIAEWASKSPKIDFANQERMKSVAKLAKRNNVGSKATNFAFKMTDGATTTLYAMKGRYTILMFYTPGCHTCEMTISQIKRMPALAALSNNRKVNLVCITAEPDEEGWKEYQNKVPEFAVNGIDSEGTILQKELYDLKASPTIYLLDKDKNVIIKDGSLEEIIDFLENNLNVNIK